MQEIEIKFQVPPRSLKAITQAVSPAGSPRRLRLRAQYFDTPTRELATQRAALRLRQEGRNWVQTFKMAGSHALERVELNHARPGPTLDLSVYADTPAEAVIQACGDRLAVRYETDVLRATRLLKTRGGSVELAFDSGEIRANGHRWPLQELEFELKSGRINVLFDLAHRWVRDHDLILDLRSKAARGDRLADIDPADNVLERMEAVMWPTAPALSGRQPAGAFLQAISDGLSTLLHNTAALARFGDTLPEAGNTHAAAVFKVLASWDASCRLFPEIAEAGFVDLVVDIEPLISELRPYLRAQLAAVSLTPLYDELGLSADLRGEEAQLDLKALLGARDFQAWQLSVLAWLLGCSEWLPEESRKGAGAKPLRRAYPALQKWQKSLANRLAAYATLSSNDKFKVRRTLERLDHSAFLLQGSLEAETYQRIRDTYGNVLDLISQIEALGKRMLAWRARDNAPPPVWFALGWATAKQAALIQDVQDMAVVVRRLDWRR